MRLERFVEPADDLSFKPAQTNKPTAVGSYAGRDLEFESYTHGVVFVKSGGKKAPLQFFLLRGGTVDPVALKVVTSS